MGEGVDGVILVSRGVLPDELCVDAQGIDPALAQF